MVHINRYDRQLGLNVGSEVVVFREGRLPVSERDAFKSCHTCRELGSQLHGGNRLRIARASGLPICLFVRRLLFGCCRRISLI